MQDGDVALEVGVDRNELLECRRHGPDERRIAAGHRDPLETDVALLTQPGERAALQHDPVLGRRLREGRLNRHVVAGSAYRAGSSRNAARQC